MTAPDLPPLFAFGVEDECMTTVEGSADPDAVVAATRALLGELRSIAPSLRGPAGWFNAYGRVYEDSGHHLELASAECASPYLLASVVERQRRVVELAKKRLVARGIPLRLANNNHSGLLQPRAATWGSHDNYYCEVHPETLTALLLPFLVTRVYAGSGGVRSPSGNYLHAVRPLFMTGATGGSTTSRRAIHSTSRQESHMGVRPKRFRYHGILADGHRSQFSLALTVGATALALKAVQHDRELPDRLAALGGLGTDAPWLRLLHRYNRLAAPGREPTVHPRVIEVQRLYLDAAARYAESRSPTPEWIPRLLGDWDDTLRAMERGDRAWLSVRLDAYIKYEVLDATLRASGHAWTDLRGAADLLGRLALCAQDYHTLDHRSCSFERLDRAGALRHRVAAPIEPGAEPTPHVPVTGTRAEARARFLRDHAGEDRFRLDWAGATDADECRVHGLKDPFAAEFDPPRGMDPRVEADPPPGLPSSRALRARLRAMARRAGTAGTETPF